MQYRAFLSYSHADRKCARWLHRALESYRLPRHLEAPEGQVLPKRLAPIFRDRDDMPSTASLSDAVNDALVRSDTLILICSPQAAESRWVNEEVRTFRRHGKADRILCFIVDGEPNAGDQSECFPAALIAPDEISGNIPEPVAADARQQGDGRKNAMLKIAAGMLGVGFDALKQRDLRRHQLRMVAGITSSLLVAAVTVTLAINATIARNDAEFRRAQAENLIDFMLVDLQEKLREIGRLDVYESVGDKALEYFAELRAEDVSKKTLAQRARNLRQIGEVSMDQGEWSTALAAFNESLLITEKLAAFDQQNAEAQIDLANSHFYVGNVHWQRGALKEARLHFETVLPIVDAVSEREPDNTNWLREKGYAYTNLGRVLELEGALEAALVAYTGVMTANQQLVALEPENPEWELELGFAHNNIGKLITAFGQLDEAEAHYRKDLEIKARIYAGKPAHNYWRSYLGVSQFYLGQLLVLKANYPEAEAHLLAALDNFDFLVEVDPNRHNWVVRRANIARELGKLNVMSARIDRGSEYLESSIKVLNELVKSNQENPGWRRNLTRSLLYAANHESRQGETDVAVEHLDAAKLHIAMLIEQEPNNREIQLLAVRADLCEAQVAYNRDFESDQAVLQKALEKLGQYYPETSDPRVLELEMLALMGLDRLDDARLIQERLQLMGFMGHTT